MEPAGIWKEQYLKLFYIKHKVFFMPKKGEMFCTFFKILIAQV